LTGGGIFYNAVSNFTLCRINWLNESEIDTLNEELDRILKTDVIAQIGYYPVICEELRNSTKNWKKKCKYPQSKHNFIL
jgi:hypothetical protein